MINPGTEHINSLATYFILILFIYYLRRASGGVSIYKLFHATVLSRGCFVSALTQTQWPRRAPRNKARAPLFKLLMQ